MSRSAAQPRKAWPFLSAMLRVSAIVELATGCALLATPSVVIQALIGSPSNQAGWIVARILGVNSARFLGQMSCQLDHAAAVACAA